MDEQAKDVVAESSPAPETETQAVTPETTATQETNVPADEGKSQEAQVEPVDEHGVPWKNRAFEWQRKTQELSEKLPEIIQGELQKFKTDFQQPQQRKYTVAELEAFAQQSPEYKPWVEEQKAQLLQEKLLSSIDEKLKAKETETQKMSQRQQAEAAVYRQFPNMFTKDAYGNVTWNSADPMTQRVAQYMNDPDMKSHPRGIEVAAKMAYADLTMSGIPVQVKKEQAMKTQMKSLEKKVMTEGGGKPVVQNTSPMRKNLDRLAQTGNIRDAQAAVAEYFRAIGQLKD
jgi:hypothetical protein